ncbi:MAG: glycosyltransferase [Bacillota bacterium]
MENYSVLMSVYDKDMPEYLNKSIESMINQSVAPDEIIIVKDGCLTEKLDEVLNRFIKCHPWLIKIVGIEKNVGLGKALNFGLHYCNNDLVARMDSDDISLNTRCEKQLNAFSVDKDLIIVGTQIDEFIYDEKQIISTRKVPINNEDIYNFGKRRNPFNHVTVMYRRQKVLEYGGYSDMRLCQDMDLFARMIIDGCKAYNINESLVLVRFNKDALQRRKNWDNSIAYMLTIKKLWKMGYSSFIDYLLVIIAQMIVYVSPLLIQKWIYRKILRKG